MQTEFCDCTDICRSTLQYLTNIFILSLIFKLKILIYIILLFLADIVALEYIVKNIRNHSAIELQRREKLRGIALLCVSVKCNSYKNKKKLQHEIYLFNLKNKLFLFYVVQILESLQLSRGTFCVF